MALPEYERALLDRHLPLDGGGRRHRMQADDDRYEPAELET